MQEIIENPTSEVPIKSLYDLDFQFWINQTVNQLKKHDFGNIDLENLIEKIESLGRNDKRAILSYLRRLCEHLLKIEYWESERKQYFRGWEIEVDNFREEIQLILKDSPSLRNYLIENYLSQYGKGRRRFLKESEINPQTVPEQPSFTLSQALEEDWLPWHPESSSP